MRPIDADETKRIIKHIIHICDDDFCKAALTEIITVLDNSPTLISVLCVDKNWTEETKMQRKKTKESQIGKYKGIRIGDIAITVEDFTSIGRKKPCLCITTSNEMVKVASFKDQYSADYFLDILLPYFIKEFMPKG